MSVHLTPTAVARHAFLHTTLLTTSLIDTLVIPPPLTLPLIAPLPPFSYRALNIQAGCQFCDRSFESEVASGRMSSTSLDHYSCVALAGVVTEYLRFGQAEGGLGDVAQLDRLLQALQVRHRLQAAVGHG
jgi:hypothetical protein